MCFGGPYSTHYNSHVTEEKLNLKDFIHWPEIAQGEGDAQQ